MFSKGNFCDFDAIFWIFLFKLTKHLFLKKLENIVFIIYCIAL